MPKIYAKNRINVQSHRDLFGSWSLIIQSFWCRSPYLGDPLGGLTQRGVNPSICGDARQTRRKKKNWLKAREVGLISRTASHVSYMQKIARARDEDAVTFDITCNTPQKDQKRHEQDRTMCAPSFQIEPKHPMYYHQVWPCVYLLRIVFFLEFSSFSEFSAFSESSSCSGKFF